MGNILTAEVAIKGTRPLWWHAFGPDALAGGKKEREGTAGNDPGEWKKTVLMGEDRRLFVDNTYVFGCIRDGAKHTPRKRGTLQPFISATMQVLDDRVYTDRIMPAGDLPTDPTEPVYLDIRGVRNPATRARNVRYRVAASTGWLMTFHVLWDKTVVSRGEMESAIIDAGRLVGIGDGRAIGFGRFVVESFTITEE